MQLLVATGSGSDVIVDVRPRVCDVRSKAYQSAIFVAAEFLHPMNRNNSRESVTSPPGGMRSIVMSLSVCLSARLTRKLPFQTSPYFFVHVGFGRGSLTALRYVIYFRFVDDVVFSY